MTRHEPRPGEAVKERGDTLAMSPDFFQLRAATVRERMVVATVQPLAYARGSYDAARIGGWWLATRIANTRWGQGSRRGWRGSSRRKGPHSPTSRRRPPPRTATRSTE